MVDATILLTHHLVLICIISIIVLLPCIMILVYYCCYMCGQVTGAIIKIKLFKPKITTEDQQKQKLMNFPGEPHVEEKAEYGSLSSSITNLKQKSRIEINQDSSTNFEQSKDEKDQTRYNRARNSNDSELSLRDENKKEIDPVKRNGTSKASLPEFSLIYENDDKNPPSFRWEFRTSNDLAAHRSPSQKSVSSNNIQDLEYVKTYTEAQNACLAVLLSAKQTDWVKIRNFGEDIIEFIEINGKKTFHIKAVVDARPDVISRIIFDEIEQIKNWSPKLTMHCTVLKNIDRNTQIVHTVITPGKVMKARDFVVLNHRTKMKVLQKDSIFISSTSVNYDCPYLQSLPKYAYTRGSNGPSCMIIYSIPDDSDRSEFRCMMNGDLGGWEPKKIGELALQAFLVRYVSGLREQIKTQSAKL